MKNVQKLLREPLVHFAVLGGLAFLIYAVVAGPGPAPQDTIVIAPEREASLSRGFESVWMRPPTDDELRALVDDFIREEIYYREALLLGLDRGDTIIRRRLRQKMEFLTDTGSDLLSPAPGELESFLEANGATFASVPRLAFEQIPFGESPDPQRLAAAMDALREDPASDTAQLGERSLLPEGLSLSPPHAVDGVFGSGFFEQLAALPSGAWAGPVQSGYGVHLVRVHEHVPGRTPALEEIHDAVLKEWHDLKALELRKALFERLRERYVVERREAPPDADAPHSSVAGAPQ